MESMCGAATRRRRGASDRVVTWGMLVLCACGSACAYDFASSRVPRCGDGLLQEGEPCDDGNLEDGDGCSAGCEVEDGFVCDDQEPSGCEWGCGNGVVEDGEECDDGNDEVRDACPSGPHGTCRVATCGDGFVWELDGGTETCDDGNGVNDDGCPDDPAAGGDCQLAEVCTDHTSCAAGQQCVGDGCGPVGNTCDDSPTLITGSTVLTGESLVNLLNTFDGGPGGVQCGEPSQVQSAGPDRFYAVEMSAGDYLTAWVVPAGWNALLYVVRGCPVTSVGCIGGWDRAVAGPGMERVDHVAQQAGTVYLVVGGVGVQDAGEFDLHVTLGHGAAQVAAPGELVITEMMITPNGHTEDCDWLELHNPTAGPLDLMGVTVTAQSDASFVIDHPLIIEPGGYAVLAATARLDQNGNLPWVSWAYRDTTFSLGDGGLLELTVTAASRTVVDAVTVGTNWPSRLGASLYLCPDFLNATDNDLGSSWRPTPEQPQFRYGGSSGPANYGTPGPGYSNPAQCGAAPP